MGKTIISKSKNSKFKMDVTVILKKDIEGDYTVVDKDLPDGLPETWTNPADKKAETIIWISNYGLKKADGAFEGVLPDKKKYTIEIDDKYDGKEIRFLLYYDGKKVKKLNTRRPAQGRLQADLNLGDPPTGVIK